MKKCLQAFALGLVFIIFGGFAYPLCMTAIGQVVFPWQANGSMITVGGKVVGSELIGQNFTDNRFFHGRVSSINYSTYPVGTKTENILPGSGSANYAVSNPDLLKRIKTDVAKFLKENPTIKKKDLPADLFTSSFSGLDPDITPADAQVQVDRIVKAAGISKTKIQQIITDNTTGRDLGIFGEMRVNVLKANLDIYKLLKK